MKIIVTLLGLSVALFVSGCAHHHTHDANTETYEVGLIELCKDCGEVKGGAKCCQAEGRTVCAKCGLFEGAPGCCKIDTNASGPILLCADCGEVKGTDACCKPEGREVCPDCGKFKGAPGCCIEAE